MLEEGEELVALEVRMRGQLNSLRRDFPALQQLGHQRIDLLRICGIRLGLEQATDDVMLPQFLAK